MAVEGIKPQYGPLQVFVHARKRPLPILKHRTPRATPPPSNCTIPRARYELRLVCPGGHLKRLAAGH